MKTLQLAIMVILAVLIVPQPALGSPGDAQPETCPDYLDAPLNESVSVSDAVNCDLKKSEGWVVSEVKKGLLTSIEDWRALGTFLEESGIPVAEDVGQMINERADSSEKKVRNMTASSV